MANLNTTINPDEAAGFSGQFEIIPPGEYPAVIVEDKLQPNKNNNGQVLVVKFELQDGTRRNVTTYLNLQNPSPVAEKIGRAELAKIAQCIGHNAPVSETSILYGRPLVVRIMVDKFNSNKDGKPLESNKIADYKPASALAKYAPASGDAKKWTF